MAEATIGSEIAGHRLEAVAGRGGMGVVYRATQLRLKRQVALKLIASDLAADAQFRERFEHESEIAASIEHPHVIPLYEAGEENGQLYITMRYIEGTDVKALITRQGAVPAKQAARIISQVAGALDAAHARGLVHRDIKPANVLIAGTNDEPHAYLTDFGLTKQAAAQGGMTKTGMFVGTLDYIAPEQLQGGPIDARADIYALGCMLYQMLTGHVPYERDTEPAKIWAHMQEPPPALRQVAPQVPEAFDEVVARAMAKSPTDRYPSAGDFGRAALAAAQDRQLGEAGERSVARGPAAPGTPTAPGGPGATAIGSPPSYPGPGQTPPRGFPTVAGGPAPPAPPSYPGGPTQQGGWPSQPGYVKGAPRSKVPLIIAGVVGAVLLIGVVALVLGSGGSDKKSGPAANPAGQIVGKPIPTGKDPSDLAFGGGAVWTANLSDGTVTRIDPATSKTTSIKVGGFPVEVDFDNNMLFVWNGTSTIVKVDPATNQVVGGPIDTGGKIDSVAAGAGSVWVTHSADNTVTRIDEKTGQIDGNPIKVGKAPQGIAFGEGAVWVANSQDKTLTKIDAGLGKVFDAPVALGDSPGGVSVADGVVYVGTTSDVTQVDPQSLTLDQPIPLKGAAFYSVGHGALWATYPTRGQLQRIDVDTKKEIGQPIKVGRRAQGVAVGDHDVPDVWIVNTKANSVTRVKP